jgi:hypothetical protein
MFTFERVLSPIPDWIIKGTIVDSQGNVIYDCGPNGISLNQWWNSQSEEFQRNYVQQFSAEMALQIVSTL